MGKCEGTLCGTLGEACCDVADGSPGDGCPSATPNNLKCINDKCAACGQIDAPCCTPQGPMGDGCVPQNAMCDNGTCKAM
jgi:hypothetical protein